MENSSKRYIRIRHGLTVILPYPPNGSLNLSATIFNLDVLATKLPAAPSIEVHLFFIR